MASIKNKKWSEIKMDYLGYMGLDAISRKYRVSKNTLKSRIRRGKWKQERELMEEEVKSRLMSEIIEDGKKSLLKEQERWHQAAVIFYQEMIEKVKDCNDVEKLNQLLVQFMTFCEMNKLIYQPENPETVYIIR